VDPDDTAPLGEPTILFKNFIGLDSYTFLFIERDLNDKIRDIIV
jgi:hypothetical protein